MTFIYLDKCQCNISEMILGFSLYLVPCAVFSETVIMSIF